MAVTKFNYLFTVASLLLLFAAQSPFAEARRFAGVNQWCRSSSYRRLCTKMVSGAATQQDASINAMRAALAYAKLLQGKISWVKSSVADLDLEKQNAVMTACADEFGSNVDDLEMSIAAMQVNDRGTVNAHLSAALRRGACNSALADNMIQSPVAIYTELMHKEVDNCLAVISQE